MDDWLQSSLFVVGWVVFFVLSHFFCAPLLQLLLTKCGVKAQKVSQDIDTLASTLSKKRKLTNLRRLLRSQLYCTGSSCVGLYLLTVEYKDLPRDFFLQWGLLHQVACTAAVAHWLLSLAEDSLAGEEVAAQVTLHPSPGQAVEGATETESESDRRLCQLMYGGLVSHHLCALVPYCWSLATHQLAGICVLGLVGEVPVLLLNMRDILVSFEEELFGEEEVHWERARVGLFWGVFQGLWLGTRTASCALYMASVCVWGVDIHSLLPPSSRIMYHCMGAMFTWINTVLLFAVLPLYLLGDLKRCERERVSMAPPHLIACSVRVGSLRSDSSSSSAL